MTTKRTSNGNRNRRSLRDDNKKTSNGNGNGKDNSRCLPIGECLELVEGFGVFVEDHVG